MPLLFTWRRRLACEGVNMHTIKNSNMCVNSQFGVGVDVVGVAGVDISCYSLGMRLLQVLQFGN